MSLKNDLQVIFEPTPNPRSLKFKVTHLGQSDGLPALCESIVEFTDAASTYRSPLARKIFGFPWAEGVLLGPDFITITKQDWVDWDTLAEPLAELIAEHLRQGQAVLAASEGVDLGGERDESSSGDEQELDPIVAKIKSVLYNEVRPAVALDGGDVSFHSYVDQIVYIYMRGACSGCPSSTYTLKMGIEARLREAVPEIREVIAL